jgi:ubiquinone/menaquinone biosynthesis C-methylase UbiE
MNIHSNLDHYTNIYSLYNSLHYQNDNYQNWLLSIIINELNIIPPNFVADIGGGTGIFSNQLFNKANLNNPVLCVDNSADMLKIASQYNGVIIQCDNAQTFVSQHKIFDRIILKEMIHHIPILEIDKLFKDIAKCLSKDGICLTITRPVEVMYPLFNKAREIWKKQQPSKETLLEHMRNSGLNITYYSIFKNIIISKENWYNMMRSRFWSTFSYLTDSEIEEGILELEKGILNNINQIEIIEELILITAKK